MSYAVVHIDALARARLDEAGWWRPVRRTLGLTAVGANAYTADEAGAPLIEPHDELSPGAGGHEELYVVLTGSATFTIADDTVEAPAGTLVRVDVGVPRAAVAAAPSTTVLVVGGRPQAAMPPSPFEYWYAAQPAYDAGDYQRAVAIAAEGLAHHPHHGGLNYQLACFHALAGDTDAAQRRLRIAFAADPRTRSWAEGDHDLDGVPRPRAERRHGSP
jgi:mannose-6-phosphate isomerase-like protein (cupin superfamily)